MKVLVTGGEGQLGFELKKISLTKNKLNWLFTDRHSFDISILDNINTYLNKCNPDIIINCAAFTSVNSAEDCIKIAEKFILKAKKYNPATRKHEVFVEKKLPPHSK